MTFSHTPVNIWSHLLGTELFVAFLADFCFRDGPALLSADLADLAAIAIFYSGVVVCFTFSTLFHVCMNHSAEAHRLGNELDHIGIIVVIWASTVPSDYLGFYCSARLQRMYWVLVCLACRLNVHAQNVTDNAARLVQRLSGVQSSPSDLNSVSQHIGR